MINLTRNPLADPFVAAYVATALWSCIDEIGCPLNGIEHCDRTIEPETLEQMREDCESFQTGCDDSEVVAYIQESDPDQVAHDFWLTRNRHGAVFCDRGLGEIGGKLTDWAHSFGTYDLYVGDDGRIYGA
jgi:hypothetical protein